jgi:uncharacterized membrane protein YidH (DUF202 family)
MTAGSAPQRRPGPGAPDHVETQVERTELAWARTSLACAGLGALAVHLSFADLGPVPGLAIGAFVAVPGLVAAWWRIRGLRAAPTPEPPRPAGVAFLAGTVAVVALATLVMLLR